MDQINDTKTKEVKVFISAPTSAVPTVKAEIPLSVLKSLVNSNKLFTIQAGKTEISVPHNVLKTMAEASSSQATIIVTLMKDAAKVTQGTVLSDVYDFTIMVEKNGKTSNISLFSKPIEVKIAVDSASLKDKRKVAAYFMNEKTGTFEYVGGKYENGKVAFQTYHFSKFVILETNKSFIDIQKYWAQDEIEVLASRSITAGKTNTKFDPAGKITRAEFTVLIARALNLPLSSFEGTFKDVSKSKEWAYPGIEAAYHAGIVKGKTKDHFDPDGLITREEIATIIIRAIQYQDASLLVNLNTTKTFADDSKISSFAKDAVNKAVALGIVKGRTKTAFEPKANATRAEAAVMLYRSLEKLKEF